MIWKIDSHVRSGSTDGGLASNNGRWISGVADRRVRPYWWPLWLLLCGRSKPSAGHSASHHPRSMHDRGFCFLSSFLQHRMMAMVRASTMTCRTVVAANVPDQYTFCTVAQRAQTALGVQKTNMVLMLRASPEASAGDVDWSGIIGSEFGIVTSESEYVTRIELSEVKGSD